MNLRDKNNVFVYFDAGRDVHPRRSYNPNCGFDESTLSGTSTDQITLTYKKPTPTFNIAAVDGSFYIGPYA